MSVHPVHGVALRIIRVGGFVGGSDGCHRTGGEGLTTPFHAPARLRSWLHPLNGQSLQKPGPLQLAHPEATLEDFRQELERVKGHQAGQWGYWPPLLVAVIDDGLGQLPAEWSRQLRSSGLHHHVLGPGELAQAKGVEYQHVFLIMGSELFKQLDAGFEGSGRNLYEQRRLLRIPYSRAKDSLALFALPHFG